MTQLPIADFLRTRLTEFDPRFDVRPGTGFESLFFKPLQFLLQPLADEANTLETAQSFRRILLQDDPDAFSEEAVDALASNLYVDRVTGSFSGGVGRVYYVAAVDREWPALGSVFTGSNGKTYTNPAPFSILATQMSSQIEEGNYYYDIPLQCTEEGEEGDLEAGGLVALTNDSEVVLVTNKLDFAGGRARETNTELINRVQRSIAVRDLVTGKGFNAILFENFASFVTELQPIGFGDPEMMRDIVYNVHIGGKVDGYFKTTSIRIGESKFVAVLTDTSRQGSGTSNAQLFGTNFYNIGASNIDRTGGKDPIVQQVQAASAAVYSSPVDLSAPVNLSTAQYIYIGIDGAFKNIKVAGSVPSQTTRNQIVFAINQAFGINVCAAFGNSIRILSPTQGLTSEIVIDDPISGTSALLAVFGLALGGGPYVFLGDGPIVFTEITHYELNDLSGDIRRVVGPVVLGAQTTGVTALDDKEFTDPTPGVFLNVVVNDMVTITTGADIGDHRVMQKIDDNTLLLDTPLTAAATGISYSIRRTGIKDGEVVYVKFWYNPLSIDIGPLVKLDEFGAVRGIRPGREDFTIVDVAFLRIRAIEIIDPVTLEPTGEFLNGHAGFGYGGFGQGPFGIGAGADYRLIINSPTERFSAFEDAYIVFNSALIGLSFRIEYDYVPEVITLHDFVRSENERVLDADILMKHFLPAFVSGTIEYSIDETDSSVPDNETLMAMTKEYITKLPAGSDLQYSDVIQFIQKSTDPFHRYGTFIKFFTLTAVIHNADGTTTVITGDDLLRVEAPDPFPRYTTAPLSPRIAHWIADELILVRMSS
jgi:hypothetical protein